MLKQPKNAFIDIRNKTESAKIVRNPIMKMKLFIRERLGLLVSQVLLVVIFTCVSPIFFQWRIGEFAALVS